MAGNENWLGDWRAALVHVCLMMKCFGSDPASLNEAILDVFFLVFLSHTKAATYISFYPNIYFSIHMYIFFTHGWHSELVVVIISDCGRCPLLIICCLHIRLSPFWIKDGHIFVHSVATAYFKSLKSSSVFTHISVSAKERERKSIIGLKSSDELLWLGINLLGFFLI